MMYPSREQPKRGVEVCISLTAGSILLCRFKNLPKWMFTKVLNCISGIRVQCTCACYQTSNWQHVQHQIVHVCLQNMCFFHFVSAHDG